MGGVVNGSVHFSEIGPNLLSEPPTQGEFSKNGSKVYEVYKSVRGGRKWEIDGVEWEYVTEEESE
jgi:hypothetical protein